MSVVTKLSVVSTEEYLDSEERGDTRREFVDGVIYAMVGASVAHNLIAGALFSLLRQHLRGSSCLVFQSDMKVRIDEVFYYPDVVVNCAKINQSARYLSDPVLVIEVLSPSTEAKDRLEKRVAYSHLASVEEYVLVSQDKIQVEIIRREGKDWLLELCSDADMVHLKSVDLTLPIEKIYEDVVGVIR